MVTAAQAFVGRASQRGEIADHLASSGLGARVAYIDGPAGIGKTSLTDAVADDWRELGGQVRWSRCWNGPGTPPLWPWLQILQAGSAPNDEGHDSATPAPADGRSAGLAKFEQFSGVVTQLVEQSRQAPLLIVIDDLHWADIATVELLDFSMRDARASEIRIVVTSRTPEADFVEHHPMLADIANHAAHLTLPGLHLADVVELAGTYGVASAAAETVHARTGGNPLFVTELLRLGQAAVDIDDADALPPSIGTVIRRHLDLIGVEAQGVLELAAVQGQSFDTDVLIAAGQLDRQEVEIMLDDARRYQLIQRRGGSWMFVHALVGDALLDGATFDRRTAHHLATADAIEKVYGTDRFDLAGTICSHLVRAGAACPAPRLSATATTAARHAGAQLAWRSQSDLLAIAIDALGSTGTRDSDREIIELLIEKCQAEKSARLLDVAPETAAKLARLVRRMNDPVLLARVALVYPPDSEGIEIDEIHDPDQVLLRTEALAALPDDEVELRIQLRAALALSMYWERPSGDRAENHQRSAARRDDLTRTALAEARELGIPSVLAAALDARIHATWGPDTAAERPGLAAELYEVAAELGDLGRMLAARVWRVAELLEATKLAEADREIAAFEADAVRMNDRVSMWTALRLRSNRAFMSGDIEAAEAIAGEALGLALQFLPEAISMSFYVTMLGPIHYIQGTLGGDLEAVVAIGAESPDVPAWQVGAATALSELGELDEARRRLRILAADDFAVLPRDLNFFGAMVMLSLVSLNVGDAEVAAAIRPYLAVRSGRYAIHGTGYTSYGPVDLSVAQCAHASGDVAGARKLYETAIVEGDRVGTPYADAARLHLGLLLVSLDHRRARQVLREAFEGFERRGADEMAGRAAALLFEVEAARTLAFEEREGGWAIQRPGGETLDLGDLKGLRALRELLIHPRTSHHALTLARVIERNTDVDVDVDHLAIERIDDQAMSAYRARIGELRLGLDVADQRGDTERSEALHEELGALMAQLAEAEGFGGRIAHEPGSADRARVNITKHLKRAIERVAAVDGVLGDHLRTSITTGMYCAYEPVVNAEYLWTT